MKHSHSSMGEQGHPLIAGHIWSQIMRSSRGKLFVYLAGLGTMCFVVFLLSSTHSNLKQLEAANQKCQQERDSSSAQLQVLYEHKVRLEQSLQQEKSDHKHTKEECEDNKSKQGLELKEKEEALKKQISQLKSSNSELEAEKKQLEESLKKQIESLQTQKDEELKKLQTQISELLADKDKIEQAKSALAWKVDQHTGEINLCRLQNQQLEEKLSDCSNNLKALKVTGATVPSVSISPQVLADKIAAASSQDQKLFSKVPSSPKDKTIVLERPHIQEQAEDNNIDRSNNNNNNNYNNNNIELDKNSRGVFNADELKSQVQRNEMRNAMLHHIPLPALLKKSADHLNSINDDNLAKDNFNNILNPHIGEQHDADNLPQVQPPDNVNQHAEKGEYGNVGMLPGQLEQPDFKDNNNNNNNHNEEPAASNLKKSVLPPPNVNEQGANDAAQVQDMLEKSPGDTNDIQNNPMHVPAVRDFHEVINKAIPHREPHLAKGRAELPDDKQYADEDDDDQDGDNEEEMGAGAGQAGQAKAFREPDFDDQEPNDNNAKEEGVVVAPK